MAVILQRLRQCQTGAELIEFALVLPLFLLITVGIIDFGFVFQQYNVVTNAAREGARLATIPNQNASAIESRVREYVKAGGLRAAPTTSISAVKIPTYPGGPFYNGVRVTVSYPCQFIALGSISDWFGAPVAPPTLRAQVVMRYESQ